ncbi:protein O-linked-mannose beta-1,2-N-acetylglucosaminyltransferase 1-like [Oratosquilla oratoria]|uniref:protein O-linked-mannose beta-1,2-N-acetylglucosaminyltransferase 1-like n=1 Tax=Oratosquilla oratoria TaxID=337810 RepID=UPI003F759DE2
MPHFIYIFSLLVRPEGKYSARISRHLRFALFHALRLYPDATKFIVLEEDVVVTADFYEFMQQASVVLDLDPSVYCVSAFNHMCRPHTKGDPSRLLRVDSPPAYGWLLPRDMVEGILPQWLPAYKEVDWDFRMWQFQRGNRSCVVPETNRARHASTRGIHSSTSWHNFQGYLATSLHDGVPVPLESPHRLVKASYDQHLSHLIDQATLLNPKKIYDHTFFANEPGVYLLGVLQRGQSDTSSFRTVGDFLDLWNEDVREPYQNVWKIPVHNSTLLVVGVPYSIHTDAIRSKIRRLKEMTKTGAVRPDDFGNHIVVSEETRPEKVREKQEVEAIERIPLASHRQYPFVYFGQVFMGTLYQVQPHPKAP